MLKDTMHLCVNIMSPRLVCEEMKRKSFYPTRDWAPSSSLRKSCFTWLDCQCQWHLFCLWRKIRLHFSVRNSFIPEITNVSSCPDPVWSTLQSVSYWVQHWLHSCSAQTTHTHRHRQTVSYIEQAWCHLFTMFTGISMWRSLWAFPFTACSFIWTHQKH